MRGQGQGGLAGLAAVLARARSCNDPAAAARPATDLPPPARPALRPRSGHAHVAHGLRPHLLQRRWPAPEAQAGPALRQPAAPRSPPDARARAPLRATHHQPSPITRPCERPTLPAAADPDARSAPPPPYPNSRTPIRHPPPRAGPNDMMIHESDRPRDRHPPPLLSPSNSSGGGDGCAGHPSAHLTCDAAPAATTPLPHQDSRVPSRPRRRQPLTPASPARQPPPDSRPLSANTSFATPPKQHHNSPPFHPVSPLPM